MALKELPTDLMRIHTGVKTLYPVEEGSKNVAPVYPDTGANGPVYPDASGQESVGTGSEESFARYCGAQSPVGDMRRIVVAAEGAKRLLGMESVSERELRYLFDLAMWRQPGDFLQSLRNAARSKFRWLERVPGATGYYTVTETGRG